MRDNSSMSTRDLKIVERTIEGISRIISAPRVIFSEKPPHENPYHSVKFTTPSSEDIRRIALWAQKNILDNVCCGRCLGSVPIVLASAKMKDKDVVLRRKCQHCGKDICRVVEPEDE